MAVSPCSEFLTNSILQVVDILQFDHTVILDTALHSSERNDANRLLLLLFRQSSDARLRRVGHPRRLGDRGGLQVWTEFTSQVNARPASRPELCGSPQPATEFVSQRCPSVVDPLCCKLGSDDIDAVQRNPRYEQTALDPLAQLVPDRAQPEFGLERPECGFQFGQSPVSTNRFLNAPLRVAGAQDMITRSGIARFKRRIALPGHSADAAIQGLRAGYVIVVVDYGVPFPQPPKPFGTLVVVPGTARFAQPIVQVSKIGLEFFPLLRQNSFILSLTGLAPDTQLRFVLMFMGQFPHPRLMPRFGLDRRIEFLGVHRFYLIRLVPTPLDSNPVEAPLAQLREIGKKLPILEKFVK